MLLISLDSVRRDLLSAYGHRSRHAPELATSPHLDRLAAEGVLLEDAYAPSSWTLPSHVSLMTGQPVLVHSVELSHQRPDPSHRSLAEILREHGYRTAGYFSGPHLEPHFGFDRGFEEYLACYGGAAEQVRAAVGAASSGRAEAASARERSARVEANLEAQRELGYFAQRDVSSTRVTDAVLGALERFADGDAPFFVFAHYFDPHYDYVPPEPFATRFDPDYDGVMDGTDFIGRPDVAGVSYKRPGGRYRTLSDRDLEHIRALYEGEMAWTDTELGRMLGRLNELGLRDDTLVVVTADHGDEFFEHGSIGHRQTLFEEVLRAPLILRQPGVLPAGLRVEGLVSTADLVPTILELAGLPAEPGIAASSFVPLIEGRQDPSERAISARLVTTHGFSVGTGGGQVPCILITISETYRRGDIKVTREVRRVQVRATLDPAIEGRIRAVLRQRFPPESLRWIDLSRFPSELAPSHSEDFSDPRARAVLQAFHDRYLELAPRRLRAEAASPDPETIEALRSLGYLEEGVEPGSIAADDFELHPPGRGVLDAVDP